MANIANNCVDQQIARDTLEREMGLVNNWHCFSNVFDVVTLPNSDSLTIPEGKLSNNGEMTWNNYLEYYRYTVHLTTMFNTLHKRFNKTIESQLRVLEISDKLHTMTAKTKESVYTAEDVFHRIDTMFSEEIERLNTKLQTLKRERE